MPYKILPVTVLATSFIAKLPGRVLTAWNSWVAERWGSYQGSQRKEQSDIPGLHKLSGRQRGQIRVWSLQTSGCGCAGRKPEPSLSPPGRRGSEHQTTMVSVRSWGRKGTAQGTPGTDWGRPDLRFLPRCALPACCCCCCCQCCASLRSHWSPAKWTTMIFAASATSRIRSPSGPAPSSV